MYTAGSTAAAAARRRRQLEEEEHDMTSYEPRDLSEDWEFKILRSMTGAFKNPQRMREVLDEESRAGWVFVEKFDNGRIRLKRPASARQRDQFAEIDPYRTYVGYTEGQFVFVLLGCIFGTIIVLGVLIASLVSAFG